MFGLYTRWFHRWALLAGWAVAMVYGTMTAYKQINPATGKHFGGSVAPDRRHRQSGYIALTAFVVNVVVAAVLTLFLRALKAPEGVDATIKGDYFADAGDPGSRRCRRAVGGHPQPLTELRVGRRLTPRLCPWRPGCCPPARTRTRGAARGCGPSCRC